MATAAGPSPTAITARGGASVPGVSARTGRASASVTRASRTGPNASVRPVRLMANARDVERLAVVELGEVELELGVLDGVGGQHVHPQRRHAPLEALAHVPGVVQA